MDSVPDLISLTTLEDTTVMMILPGTLPLRDFREGKTLIHFREVLFRKERAAAAQQIETKNSYLSAMQLKVV